MKNQKRNPKELFDGVFSLYIRLRDAMEYGYTTCISCGQVKQFNRMECGHFIPRGNLITRFDEYNCNSQCAICNEYKSGDLVNYRENLIKKYGEEKVLELESLKYKVITPDEKEKHTDDYYLNEVKRYRALIRKLKKDKCI